jgi:hypothetical protein
VAGIETVRTILALSAMDSDLKGCASDISNAFLYGKNIDRTMIKAGPEFGELQGKMLIVEGGWYGHKTAAATFHAHLAGQLRRMGFTPTKADLDSWVRKAKDGTYEYIASHVDDIIFVSKDNMESIEALKHTYSLKGIGTPEYYLGGNFSQVDNPELMAKGIKTALSAETYIVNSVEKFGRMFGEELKTQKSPMIEASHLESDDAANLSREKSTQYRGNFWIAHLDSDSR